MLQITKNTLDNKDVYMRTLVLEDNDYTIKFYLQEPNETNKYKTLNNLTLICKVKSPDNVLPIALIGNELLISGDTECLLYLNDRQSNSLIRKINNTITAKHEIADVIKKYFGEKVTV